MFHETRAYAAQNWVVAPGSTSFAGLALRGPTTPAQEGGHPASHILSGQNGCLDRMSAGNNRPPLVIGGGVDWRVASGMMDHARPQSQGRRAHIPKVLNPRGQTRFEQAPNPL